MVRAQTIGLDIAKDVFQVHGIDANGRTVVRKQLKRDDVESFFKRRKPCLVGLEATSSSHHWARRLRTFGHSVRLVHATHAKAFVKSQKNDAADAEAICEAILRPSMRFIPVKSETQQALLIVHSTRDLLVGEYTKGVSALRSHLAEFGIVTKRGTAGRNEALAFVNRPGFGKLPSVARQAMRMLVDHVRRLRQQIRQCETELSRSFKASAPARRLATIPYVAKITANAIVTTIGDGSQFRSGRYFAAWLGLVPRQMSSGGKQRLGRISKRGNPYLRKLLCLSAGGLLRYAPFAKSRAGAWALKLRARKPYKVTVVALAAKLARVIWSMLKHGTKFNSR